jgi:hypothetical protein
MSDINFSPFPDPGRHFYFTLRPAVSVRARPDYARDGKKLTLADLTSFSYRIGRYPFFSWNFWNWHGYAGWKPITLADPAFYWQEHPNIMMLKESGCLFVQLSARQGFGAIS